MSLYPSSYVRILFFFNDTATTEIYTLSLHDALPICRRCASWRSNLKVRLRFTKKSQPDRAGKVIRSTVRPGAARDRKSTRLNSSHDQISYAVFCLKKKKVHRLHAHNID